MGAGDRKWGVWEQRTGVWEQGVGVWEPETGNGNMGTGDWEWESGNRSCLGIGERLSPNPTHLMSLGFYPFHVFPVSSVYFSEAGRREGMNEAMTEVRRQCSHTHNAGHALLLILLCQRLMPEWNRDVRTTIMLHCVCIYDVCIIHIRLRYRRKEWR